jgi:microcystin degradation protein MlrC
VNGDIINVSIMAGFVYGDCPKNGYTAVVTAKNRNRRAAFEVARDICKRPWAMRERFNKPMTSLDEAVRRAVDAGINAAPCRPRDVCEVSIVAKVHFHEGGDPASAASILLADVADNPGGGGRGNTTWRLRALVEADAQGVVIGVFNDAPLAAEAHRLGIGATFEACFNRAEDQRFSLPYSRTATVMALSDGVYTGRRGVNKGVRSSMGPSALLSIGGESGVNIVVISNRQQCMDPMQLELLGVDIAAARTVVLKSRGHFRAGFDEFFTPDRIIEVDCPGLTSPLLHSFEWKRLPRPVYPLDRATEWMPPPPPKEL